MRHIRTKRMSKEKNQRYHSKIRALQHFGEQLTNADLQKMAEVYRHSPYTRILRKQSNRVVKAIIGYKGKAYPIVYDKERHQIATILKPDYLSKEDRKIYDNFQAMLICSSNSFGNVVISEDIKIETTEQCGKVVPTAKEEVKEPLDSIVFITEYDEEIMKEFFDNLDF